MPKRDANELGKWMAKVESKLEDLAKSRLSNAALDGTTLWIRDDDGNLRSRLGRQADGSYGNLVIRVQPPPQLTAPILTAGEQAGTCVVKWDGQTFDGRPMPQVHGHTEIWAEYVADDWSPTVAPGDDAERVGTIRDRAGGEQLVALPRPGQWAVWLRAMGADRETAGPWSPVATVEIAGNVDVEAIEQELQDARDRLEAAEAKAADAIQRVTDLGVQWDEVDFPQLKVDLEQAQQAVADAEVRLDAAEQGVSESQAGLIDLRDVRLPALRGDLDSIESAVADYDQRIVAAQAGADQANATANTLRDQTLPALDDRLSGNEDEIDALTGTVLPALDSRLTTSEAAVSAAESRLTNTEQDVSSAQAGLTDLRDVQLPGLRTELNAVESVIEDYEGRITTAQAGADQANATADRLEGEVLPALDDRLADNEQALEAAEGTLSETRLGMENLRDVALPDLDDRLTSGIQEADTRLRSLAITGSSGSLFSDPLFERLSASYWQPNNVGQGFHSTGLAGTRALSIQDPNQFTDTATIEFYANSVDGGVPAAPGENFIFSCTMWPTSFRINQRIILRFRDSYTGAILKSHSGPWTTSSGSQPYNLKDTAPDEPSYLSIEFQARGEVTGRANFYNPRMVRQIDGELIVDGSISARHIMAESIAGAVGEFLQISAEQIDTEGLAAYLATIIELDAEQIVSGQISTARLDAEEVAGAVANFLTLDALEINVEQLAGEIANIIEITAESIAAGAISTRHLAIADFENLMPQQAIEDLAANGDNTEPWTRIRGNTNRWTTVTGQGRGMRAIRINDGTESHARTTLEYAPGGRLGIPLSPGDSLRLSFYGWAGGTGAAPVISLLVRDTNGSFVGRADSVSAQSGWNEYALEIHNTDEQLRYLRVEFDVPAGVAMRGHWQDFKLRHMENGELIVDGSIQGRHVQAESVAAAVGQFLELHANQIAAGAIQADQIDTSGLAVQLATIISLDAGRITSGTIDTARLNAQQIAAAVGQFLEINAEAITSGTIDTARLNVQHLAGEIAEFLTITAEHIDVGSIAGAIANVLEITAENIATGAISARHMAITDPANLMPQQAIEDLSTHGDNTGAWSRIRGTANRWTTVTGQGRGMRAIRINDGAASSVRTTVEYRAAGRGVPLGPGESMRLSFYGWAGGSGAAPSFALVLRNESGGFVTRVDSTTASSGWNEYALEVHNTAAEARYLCVEFDVAAGEAMRGHWQDFKLRHMGRGELLVDGTIGARHVIADEIAAAVGEFLELHADQITAGTIDADLLNVNDLAAQIATVITLNASRITTGQLSAARIDIGSLFADSGFISNLAAEVVEAIQLTTQRIITGDIIATGTIDVENLNVTEQMVGEFAQFLTVEADNIAANAIDGMTIRAAEIIGSVFRAEDNNGNETVRLDGASNFISGELDAKASPSSSVLLTSGSVTYREGYQTGEAWNLSYRNRTVQGPNLKFLHESLPFNSSPSIVMDEETNELILAPAQTAGGYRDRQVVTIPGRVQTEQLVNRGTAHIFGNLSARGTVGTHNNITMRANYISSGTPHWRHIGQMVILSLTVGLGSRPHWGSGMFMVPPPQFEQRIPVVFQSGAASTAVATLVISTDGWASLFLGETFTTSASLPLHGVTYLADPDAI